MTTLITNPILTSRPNKLNSILRIIAVLTLIDEPLITLYISIFNITLTDLKDYDIYYIDLAGLFVSLNYRYDLKFELSFLLVILLLFYFAYKGLMGYGDLYLLGSLKAYFDLYAFIDIIFIASLSALIAAILLKKKILPFGPFILWGFLLKAGL